MILRWLLSTQLGLIVVVLSHVSGFLMAADADTDHVLLPISSPEMSSISFESKAGVALKKEDFHDNDNDSSKGTMIQQCDVSEESFNSRRNRAILLTQVMEEVEALAKGTGHYIFHEKSPTTVTKASTITANDYKDDFYMIPKNSSTIYATRSFPKKGQALLEIPRIAQIWATDAFLNPWIRHHLIGAKHIIIPTSNQNPSEEANTAIFLHNGAYLAAYIALLSVLQTYESTTTTESDGPAFNIMASFPWYQQLHQQQQLYISYLPNAEDYYAGHHPILYTVQELKDIFGQQSLTYQRTLSKKLEWESEYDAFVLQSRKASSTTTTDSMKTSSMDHGNDKNQHFFPFFEDLISKTDYLIARINVASRSFATGVPSQRKLSDIIGTGDHSTLTETERKTTATMRRTTRDDLEWYQQMMGYNYLTDGVETLVPILDAYNHHATKLNVKYQFYPAKQSFRISTATPIHVGDEFFTSYGPQNDAWMYAVYGFVNEDGSGPCGSSLAAYHSVHHRYSLDDEEKDDRSRLLCYLEPYSSDARNCPPNGISLDIFKSDFDRAKWRVLKSLENNMIAWKISLSPRTHRVPGTNIPRYSGTILSRMDEEETGIDGSLSLARLLTLQPSDYEGQATKILMDHAARFESGNQQRQLFPKGAPGLEYRARKCLGNLVRRQLENFEQDISSTIYAHNPEATETREQDDILNREIQYLLQKQEELGRIETAQANSGTANMNKSLSLRSQIQESHIRLGEIQVLSILEQYTKRYLRVHMKDNDESQ